MRTLPRGLAGLAGVLVLIGAATVEVSPLIEAAKNRDWDAVRSLVDEGADPKTRGADGATALHWTSYWDEVEAAELLLRAGADAGAANDLGATPLWLASQNGSVAMARTLLEAGADPNAALPSGETPVMAAARTGDSEVLEVLLAAGGDPNVAATRSQTALMWAVAQHHPEAVRVLLDHGADVSARSERWSQVMAVPPHSHPANRQDVPHGANTALLFAARGGDVASARLLIGAGADVNDVDAAGVSATALAAHSGFGDLVELLLDAGADPNAAAGGFAALHAAVFRRDLGLARTLLEHGADPDVRVTNWTPTRRASRDWSIHPSLVGATPFWLAARFTQPAMMRLLAEHGADPLFVHRAEYVAASGSFGYAADPRVEETNALMATVGMGGPRRLRAFMSPERAELEALSLESAKLAVELGVEVDARDLQGRTATEMSSYKVVRDFLTAEATGR